MSAVNRRVSWWRIAAILLGNVVVTVLVQLLLMRLLGDIAGVVLASVLALILGVAVPLRTRGWWIRPAGEP